MIPNYLVPGFRFNNAINDNLYFELIELLPDSNKARVKCMTTRPKVEWIEDDWNLDHLIVGLNSMFYYKREKEP